MILIASAAALLLAGSPVNKAACELGSPLRTTLAELNENLEVFRGRCVTVSGQTRATALIGGGEAMPDGLPRHRLGVYEREPYSWLMEKDRRSEWQLTGVIDDCGGISRLAAEEHARAVTRAKAEGWAEPAPPMLGGFCHYHNGPIIWLVSYRRLRSAG